MRWRLLLDQPAEGAFNMAVDEALYRSACERVAPPTVRLYTWSRPTVSIGYRQELRLACDVLACQRLGITSVRRMSGGRAVLHDRELTYCLVSPAEGPFHGLSVREVYAWVSDVLRATFQRLELLVDRPALFESAGPGENGISEFRKPPGRGGSSFERPPHHELRSGWRRGWDPDATREVGGVPASTERSPQRLTRLRHVAAGTDRGAAELEGLNSLQRMPPRLVSWEPERSAPPAAVSLSNGGPCPSGERGCEIRQEVSRGARASSPERPPHHELRSGWRRGWGPGATREVAGAPASTERRLHRAGSGELPCFAVPSGHEITWAGQKLVGSAQKWSRRGFLQHGSILLHHNRGLWQEVMGLPAGARLEAIGLDEVAGRSVGTEELAVLLEREFRRAFGEPPSDRNLLPQELDLAWELLRTKYGTGDWTEARRSPLR